MTFSDYKRSKLTEPNLLRKFLLAQKWDKKAQNSTICPFVRYYSIFLRIGSLVFFIFSMKLRDHRYLKLTEPNFLEKFLLARKQAKKAQSDPICVFVRYDSTIFCMKFREHKYTKLTEPNFMEKFLLVRKWAKKTQNGLIYLFVHYGSIFSQDWRLLKF